MSTNDKWRLDGKNALVTGGTKGIGKAIVEEFAKLGAQVFTCSRSSSDIQSCLSEWRSRGLNTHACVCDVSSSDARAQLILQARSVFGGKLHILVNNVGTSIRKPTVEYSEEEYRKIMGTNLDSIFALCQLAHPMLKAAENSSIVMNSSVGGSVALRSGSIYGATKGAINQLTRNLACEWAKDGIRVNAVAPWYIKTELARPVIENEQLHDEIICRTPMRRVGEPEEVGAVVAFLCLPAASYVSGQVLAIDGAFSVNGFYPFRD